MARVKKLDPVISIEELEKYYREINRTGFSGSLPDRLPIKYVGTTKTAGRAVARLTHTLPERARRFDKYKGAVLDYSSLAIELSVDVNRSVDQVKAMLLHEMIHIYFFVVGDWHESHGSKFMAKLHGLEQLTGLKIPVSENVEPSEMSLHATTIGVIVVRDQTARYKFALVTAKVARDNLDAIVERLTRFNQTSIKVYLSNSRRITELSLQTATQRSFGPNTKFFSLRDTEEANATVRDLEESGTLLR